MGELSTRALRHLRNWIAILGSLTELAALVAHALVRDHENKLPEELETFGFAALFVALALAVMGSDRILEELRSVHELLSDPVLLKRLGEITQKLKPLVALDEGKLSLPVLQQAAAEAAHLSLDAAPALAKGLQDVSERRATRVAVPAASPIPGTMTRIVESLPQGGYWLGITRLSVEGWDNPDLVRFNETIERRSNAGEVEVRRIYCIPRHKPLSSTRFESMKRAERNRVQVRVFLEDPGKEPADITLLADPFTGAVAGNGLAATLLGARKVTATLQFEVYGSEIVRQMAIDTSDKAIRDDCELFDSIWSKALPLAQVAKGQDGPIVPLDAVDWAFDAAERNHFKTQVQQPPQRPEGAGGVDEITTCFVDFPSAPGFLKLQRFDLDKANEHLLRIRSAAGTQTKGTYPTVVLAGVQNGTLQMCPRVGEDLYRAVTTETPAYAFAVVLYEGQEIPSLEHFEVRAHEYSVTRPVQTLRFSLVSSRRAFRVAPVLEIVPLDEPKLWRRGRTTQLDANPASVLKLFAPILEGNLLANAFAAQPDADGAARAIADAAKSLREPQMRGFGVEVPRTQNDLIFLVRATPRSGMASKIVA